VYGGRYNLNKLVLFDLTMKYPENVEFYSNDESGGVEDEESSGCSGEDSESC
jgi:hypothetical protein